MRKSALLICVLIALNCALVFQLGMHNSQAAIEAFSPENEIEWNTNLGDWYYYRVNSMYGTEEITQYIGLNTSSHYSGADYSSISFKTYTYRSEYVYEDTLSYVYIPNDDIFYIASATSGILLSRQIIPLIILFTNTTNTMAEDLTVAGDFMLKTNPDSYFEYTYGGSQGFSMTSYQIDGDTSINFTGNDGTYINTTYSNHILQTAELYINPSDYYATQSWQRITKEEFEGSSVMNVEIDNLSLLYHEYQQGSYLQSFNISGCELQNIELNSIYYRGVFAKQFGQTIWANKSYYNDYENKWMEHETIAIGLGAENTNFWFEYTEMFPFIYTNNTTIENVNQTCEDTVWRLIAYDTNYVTSNSCTWINSETNESVYIEITPSYRLANLTVITSDESYAYILTEEFFEKPTYTYVLESGDNLYYRTEGAYPNEYMRWEVIGPGTDKYEIEDNTVEVFQIEAKLFKWSSTQLKWMRTFGLSGTTEEGISIARYDSLIIKPGVIPLTYPLEFTMNDIITGFKMLGIPDPNYADENSVFVEFTVDLQTYHIQLNYTDRILSYANVLAPGDATPFNLTMERITAADVEGNSVPDGSFEVKRNGLTIYCTPNVESGDETLTYFWDFGDGTTSTEKNPTHTYSSSGTYTITLTVEDETEDTYETEKSVEVDPAISDFPDTIDTAWIYVGAIGGSIGVIAGIYYGSRWFKLKRSKDILSDVSPKAASVEVSKNDGDGCLPGFELIDGACQLTLNKE